MSQQGEAAEQIVNMVTNVTVKGVECATKEKNNGIYKKKEEGRSPSYIPTKMRTEKKSSVGKPSRPMRRRISAVLKSSTSRTRVHSCLQISRPWRRS